MLSAIIFLIRNYPTMQNLIFTIGSSEVFPFESSHTTNRLLQFSPNLIDRSRTASQRSEPNSRTILMDEQSNP